MAESQGGTAPLIGALWVDYEYLCDLTVAGVKVMTVGMLAIGAVVVVFLSGSGVGGSKVVPVATVVAMSWWRVQRHKRH